MNIKLSYLFFLLILICNSSVVADEIELRIIRSENSKIRLRLQFVNHSQSSIRLISFDNGSANDLYAADSSGNLVPHLRFAPPAPGMTLSNRRPFTIHSGNITGCFIHMKSFKFPADGIYYMVCAIPKPKKTGIIVSSPYKLFVKGDEFETIDPISFDELPEVVKNTFRSAFEKFMGEERIPLEFRKLPF